VQLFAYRDYCPSPHIVDTFAATVIFCLELPLKYRICYDSLERIGTGRTTEQKRSEKMNTFVDERWLSVEEIAVHLGIKRDTIYKWIERKEMPAHKVGTLWKFRRSEIDAWVLSGKASDHPKSR
jgi:excisionase family DNA binding protein